LFALYSAEMNGRTIFDAPKDAIVVVISPQIEKKSYAT